MITFDKEKLRKVLEVMGISQKEIVKHTGFSKFYVSMLLSGQKPFTDNVQKKLNQMYVEVTDLNNIEQKIKELDSVLK